MALLSVDIGGTFTDIVLDTGAGRLVRKVLTTARAPEQAVLAGTRAVLSEAGLGFGDVASFVHGTTLATNAIIERKGARTALVATEGFRDVLEIADEGRYDQYDVFVDKPVPLVPRRLRFTVAERMDIDGRVRLPLDEAGVRAVAGRLREAGVEAVAVAFLHAYRNGDHERRVREVLAAECPGIAVTLASEVAPEIREYERTSTAVANAYVQPLMAGYLGRLAERFSAEGSRAPIQLMTSGGSLASLETARRFPIRLVESGPAGGAILAAAVAAERGLDRVLSFDMGGTTAKICLIERATPLSSRSFEVDRAARFLKGSGLPVRIPVIEMVEIGAGGGSLARLDALRRITVGPDSAGSEPGPACYGRGGTAPTVTDADLVLGRIDPGLFAGGSIALSPEAASRSVEETVGAPLALATPEAAHGIAEIVDENMANAARVHAVERGLVASDHVLVAFGGAAPLHASRLAEKLGIRQVVVPPDAGVGSAVGFLRAPAAYELVRSRYLRLDRSDLAAANGLLAEMSREARALAAGAAGGRALVERRLCFMRYLGQGHEIAVPLPNRDLGAVEAGDLRVRFEAEYGRLFARHIPGAAIEVLSWAVRVGTEEGRVEALPEAAPCPGPEPIGRRLVHLDGGAAPREIPVYARRDFQPGAGVPGPALVVEDGTSTFVGPLFAARMDAGGALVLDRIPEGAP